VSDAAQFARGETQRIPVALMYAFQAENYGVLPEQGGLRQQPARLMLTMNECLAVYRAVAEYRKVPAGSGAAWKKNNPDKARLLRVK